MFVGSKGGNQGDKLNHNTATESSSAKYRNVEGEGKSSR